MTPDKAQNISSMSTRQKVIGIITLIVVIIVIWQIISLFKGPSASNVAVPDSSKTALATGGKPNINTVASSSATPQPASLSGGQGPMTQREAQLMQLQQETQAKYLSSLNDLQMLKIQRDIAETNQAIQTAKLSAVQSQKKMVDLLSPPAPPANAYAKNLVTPTPMLTTPITPTSSYSVISVSQIQYQWNAVMGLQGNLYSVKVGDILPADGSRVMSIDKNGVVLMKDGVRKRISLVPII